jgi:hypothetical protein
LIKLTLIFFQQNISVLKIDYKIKTQDKTTAATTTTAVTTAATTTTKAQKTEMKLFFNLSRDFQ